MLPTTGLRKAGVTIPLFSLRTERSWGIGDIGDLAPFAAWVASAGVRLVQLLPLGEIGADETSPYSALTAFGIDPIYLSMAEVPELPPLLIREAVGGDVGLRILQDAQAAERVDYKAVRFVKNRALRFSFRRFLAVERARNTERAEAFDAFCASEKHWLEDYSLFRALRESNGQKPWWEWPMELRERTSEGLHRARTVLASEVKFHQYVQWLAHTQWDAARDRLRALGVEVMGDLPFMVGRDSADVWACRREFRHDRIVGVPPDQFNEEGQDWGLPPYHWAVMRSNDFAWLRRRSRYAGRLYDRFRIDHVVGFFRTYTRTIPPKDPRTGKLLQGVFDPAEERAQLAHGERVLTAMLQASREYEARLIAEDLGIVPDPVRAMLTKLDVPGYRVLIWEKDKQVFRNPQRYPVRSVACLGTHDSDSVAVWWETLEATERAAVKELPGLREHAAHLGAEYTPVVQRLLQECILGAQSELVLLMMQDVLGLRVRINTPATVGPQNWTWRLPKAVEELRKDSAVRVLLDELASSIRAAGR